jgi:serine protease
VERPRVLSVALLPARTVALLCTFLILGMTAGAHAATRDQQWGLEQIGAPAAWEATRGEDVVIAIVDTGVDLTHPDLAPRLLRDGDGRVVGRDEVDPGSAPQDEHGHGTLVAGVAAAAHDAGLHGHGIAGVAPRARIMPVRVLDEDGMGSMSTLDAGIRWAVDNGADVINLSLEAAVPLPGEVVATGPDDAVNYAWERGVPVVAAAGNGTAATGTPFTDYRSSTPVLLVGASDQRDRRAAFSDAGRRDMVLAPGVDIISSHCKPCGRDAEHGYATASGTSLAAPHAAGAVALLLAAGLDHEQALRRLRETAVEVPGGGVAGTSGHGRIDAAAALAMTMRAQGDGGGASRDEAPSGAGESADARPEQPSAPTASEPSTDGLAADQDAATSGEPAQSEDTEPAAQAPAEQEADAPDGADGADATDDEASEPAAEGDGAGDPEGDGPDPDLAVDVPVGRDRSGVLAGVAAGLVVAATGALAAVHRRFGLF